MSRSDDHTSDWTGKRNPSSVRSDQYHDEPTDEELAALRKAESAIDRGARDEANGHLNAANLAVVDRDLERDRIVAGLLGTTIEGQVKHRDGLRRYCIGAMIGDGGSAIVFADRDDADVCMKVLTNETFRHRFDDEVQVLASLHHEKIVGLLDHGYMPLDAPALEGARFIVMRRYSETLADRISSSPNALDNKTAIMLFAQLAEALVYLEESNTVMLHRDLKPGNLLLDGNDLALADFTLFKPNKLTPRKEMTQFAMGTPQYMSPEQLEHDESIDIRSDIFSFGICLYESLTQVSPFTGPNVDRKWINVKTLIPPDAAVVNEQISGALNRVCMKCLEKNPDQRFQSAKELLIGLQEAHDDDGVLTSWQRKCAAASRIYRQYTRQVLVIAGGLLLMVAVLLIVSESYRRERVLSGKLRHEKTNVLREAENARLATKLAETNAEKERRERKRADANALEVRQVSHRLLLTSHLQSLRAARVARDLGRYREAHRELATCPIEYRGWAWHRVRASLPRLHRTTIGYHDGAILAAARNQQSDRFYTAGADGRVLEWSFERGALVRTLEPGHFHEPRRRYALAVIGAERGADLDVYTQLTITPDGEHLIACGVRHDGTPPQGKYLDRSGGRGVVRIWQLGAEGTVVADDTISLPSAITAAAEIGGEMVTGSVDGSVVAIDVATRAQRAIVIEGLDAEPITSIVRLTDATFAAGAGDGVRLVDHTTGEVIAQAATPGRVRCLLTLDDNLLAVGADALAPILLRADVAEESLIREREFDRFPDGGSVETMSITPDGNDIIAGTGNGYVVIWDRRFGTRKFALNDQVKSPLDSYRHLLPASRQICFVAQEADKVWTAGFDSTIKATSIQSSSTTRKIVLPKRSQFAWDQGGADLYWYSDQEGSVMVKSLASDSTLTAGTAHSSPVTRIKSVGSGQAVSASTDGVKFWRVIDGALEQELPPIAHRTPIDWFDVDAEAQHLAIYDRQGKVSIFDFKSRRLVGEATLRTETEIPRTRKLVFDRSGQELAILGIGQETLLYDIDKKRTSVIPSFGSGNGALDLIASSIEDRIYFAGDNAGRLNRSAGQDVWLELKSPIRAICCDGVDRRPHSQLRMAVVDDSGTIRILRMEDLEICEELSLPSQSKQRVSDAAFDPSGRWLAVRTANNAITLFDRGESGPELASTATVAGVATSNAVPVAPYAQSIIEAWEDDQGRTNLVTTHTKGSVTSVYLTISGAPGTNEVQLFAPDKAKLADGRYFRMFVDSVRCTRNAHTVTVCAMIPVNGVEFQPTFVEVGTRTVPEILRRVKFTEAGNHGQFALPSRSLNAVAHFSSAGYNLCFSRSVDDKWRTELVGLQGDGTGLCGIQSGDDKLHCATSNFRVAGGIATPVFFTLDATTGKVEHRTLLDTTLNAHVCGITAEESGGTTILISRRAVAGADEVLLLSLNARHEIEDRQVVFSSTNGEITGARQLLGLPGGSKACCVRTADGSVYAVRIGNTPTPATKLPPCRSVRLFATAAGTVKWATLGKNGRISVGEER